MARNADPDRDDRIAVTIGVVIVDLFLVGVGFCLLIAIGFESWTFDSQPASGAAAVSIAQKQYSQVMYLGGALLLALIIGGIVALRVGAMGAVVFQCAVIVFVLVVTVAGLRDYHHHAHPVTTTNNQPTNVNPMGCMSPGFCPSGSAG